jgi:two-component system LytT family response regulator
MTPISCVIVDDDLNCIHDVQFALSRISQPFQIMGIAQSVSDAIELINKTQPELAFLDVELGLEQSFSILKKLNVLPTVIFITAHEHYSLKAIKSNAFDYLLKPVDEDELSLTVQRFVAIRELKEIQRDWQEMKQKMLSSLTESLKKPNQVEKLLIRQAGRLVVVQLNDIQIVEGESNYARIYLNDGSKMLTSMTLKEIETLLNSDQFFRCHKSFIVNLKQVDEIQTGEEPTIILKNKTKVQIARRRVKDLIHQLSLMS